MNHKRRLWIANAAGLAFAYTLPDVSRAAPSHREFSPRPDGWRTFDVTVRVDVQQPGPDTRAWLPVPSVDSPWQRTLHTRWTSNGQARLESDARYGARWLHVEFPPGEPRPWVELSCLVQTRNRAVDWSRRQSVPSDPSTLKFWTEPTELLPTDGIVRRVAVEATRGARTDVEKARRIYDWVITNTWREPKVRGCGTGDIRTMLETGDLGGKCADLNAVFVGLCRAAGLPARDVYGLRLAPSAFGYAQLGSASSSLQGAQHCRAEVHLRGHGWVAMDPADVTKVMRHETPQWIKSTRHPVVTPVYDALFGSWEGNWLAWNMAHDLDLPRAQGGRLGFLMYPVAETAGERLDSYSPDAFRYRIAAREIDDRG